jgi:uncharacterized protein GlcG (DUF336 family)
MTCHPSISRRIISGGQRSIAGAMSILYQGLLTVDENLGSWAATGTMEGQDPELFPSSHRSCANLRHAQSTTLAVGCLDRTENAMPNYKDTVCLTHSGAMNALAAAVKHASTIGIPQCIFLVDASGETIASIRMDGAKYLSMHTARSKARTAASINGPTGSMPTEFGFAAGIASQGGVTPLPGGLPIRFGGKLAGAIGVGSGTGDQDFEVARAALAAIGADAI